MDNRTDSKLKSVAKKLEGIIPEGSAQTVYDMLREIMRKHKDYFGTYSAISVLKLTLYIYSLKKTNGFELAEQIMNDLFFASLFATENNLHKESCDNCNGDGYVHCGECDGTGNIVCNVCDGDGDVNCDECDGEQYVDCEVCGGSGEDDEGETCGNCSGDGQVKCEECNGKGTTTCWECAGDGETSCRNCDGNGSENCYECDGLGDIETDEIEYDVYEICSWSEDLYNILELKLDSEEPAISNENLTKFNKSIIFLREYEDNDEFNIDLEENTFYCFGINKKDEINLNSDISLSRNNFAIQLTDYIGNYLA